MNYVSSRYAFDIVSNMTVGYIILFWFGQQIISNASFAKSSLHVESFIIVVYFQVFW